MFNIKLTPLLLFCLLIFILLISVLFRNNFPLAESFSPRGVSYIPGPRGRPKEGDDAGQGEIIKIFQTGNMLQNIDGEIKIIQKTNTSGDMISNEDSLEDSPEESLEESLEDSTKEATFIFDGMREPVIKASNRINSGSMNVKFKNRPGTPSFFVPPDALEQ